MQEAFALVPGLEALALVVPVVLAVVVVVMVRVDSLVVVVVVVVPWEAARVERVWRWTMARRNGLAWIVAVPVAGPTLSFWSSWLAAAVVSCALSRVPPVCQSPLCQQGVGIAAANVAFAVSAAVRAAAASFDGLPEMVVAGETLAWSRLDVPVDPPP